MNFWVMKHRHNVCITIPLLLVFQSASGPHVRLRVWEEPQNSDCPTEAHGSGAEGSVPGSQEKWNSLHLGFRGGIGPGLGMHWYLLAHLMCWKAVCAGLWRGGAGGEGALSVLILLTIKLKFESRLLHV